MGFFYSLVYISIQDKQVTALCCCRFSMHEVFYMRYSIWVSEHAIKQPPLMSSAAKKVPLKMYWTLASCSLAAVFSTVSALSFCCLTAFQLPRFNTASAWIKACLQWDSLCWWGVFFLLHFFPASYFSVPTTDPFYAFVTPKHASGCSWIYLYNK